MSIDIDAIEARANAATPGPWYSDDSDNMDDAGNHYSVMYGDGWYLARVWKDLKQSNCVADAAFIASARQDVPALCAEVRELRAALERARAVERQLRIASDDTRASYETSRAYERAANDLEAALGVAPVSAQTCQECGHLESEHRSVAGGLGFACRHAGCDCIKQAAAPGGAA